MMEYTPDNWVIINIGSDVYKILAGWSGSYADATADSWRMNSGISSYKKKGDYYYFYGYSGSIYKCHKNSEFLKTNCGYIYDQLKKLHGDKVSIIKFSEFERL